MKVLSLWLIAILFFLGKESLTGQTDQAFPLYSIPNTQVRTLESDFVEDMVYKIDIALPESYHGSEESYPVLYILDSWFYFGNVVQTYRALRVFEEVPELIIVGISHFGETQAEDVRTRSRDYTPTEVDSSLWLPVTGGAPQFQQFISKELFPFIDHNYRTLREDRALYGASAGGIFATYVMFNHPGMFQRYIIGGPAAWYDDYIVLTYEKEYALHNSDLPARVFMTVGENEWEGQITGWKLLTDSMQSRDYADLEMTSRQIEEEGHVSQALIALIKGMQAVYK